MYHKIIQNEQILFDFVNFLPNHKDDEVYYCCLFSRHKYCKQIVNAKDNTLSRFIARKHEIIEKIRRLECPIGSYNRHDIIVPDEGLALYIGLNPRSLTKANKELLVTLARRLANNDINFSPISAATTEIHRAVGTKHFVSFDFDDKEIDSCLEQIKQILLPDSFHILKTRGGFHLIVEIKKLVNYKVNWYNKIKELGSDVSGSNTLIPVPGCVQGGFIPYFHKETYSV